MPPPPPPCAAGCCCGLLRAAAAVANRARRSQADDEKHTRRTDFSSARARNNEIDSRKALVKRFQQLFVKQRHLAKKYLKAESIRMDTQKNEIAEEILVLGRLKARRDRIKHAYASQKMLAAQSMDDGEDELEKELNALRDLQRTIRGINCEEIFTRAANEGKSQAKAEAMRAQKNSKAMEMQSKVGDATSGSHARSIVT